AAIAAHISILSAHQYRVAIKGHGMTELISGRAVRGGQLRLLRPGCAETREGISRALIGTTAHIGVSCPHQGRLAVEGHGTTELVTGHAIGGCELFLLYPCCSRAREHISRALVGITTYNGGNRPYQRRVAVE